MQHCSPALNIAKYGKASQNTFLKQLYDILVFILGFRQIGPMVLECVRVRSLPSGVRESDIESDWSDLNISDKGILHLQNRFFVFFKDKNDAEDAVNRGFRFQQTDYKAKQIR